MTYVARLYGGFDDGRVLFFDGIPPMTGGRIPYRGQYVLVWRDDAERTAGYEWVRFGEAVAA